MSGVYQSRRILFHGAYCYMNVSRNVIQGDHVCWMIEATIAEIRKKHEYNVMIYLFGSFQ